MKREHIFLKPGVNYCLHVQQERYIKKVPAMGFDKPTIYIPDEGWMEIPDRKPAEPNDEDNYDHESPDGKNGEFA